jgi:hypothetical protein
MMASFVGNCGSGAADRLVLLRELGKHMQIDNFGGCLKNADVDTLLNGESIPAEVLFGCLLFVVFVFLLLLDY